MFLGDHMVLENNKTLIRMGLDISRQQRTIIAHQVKRHVVRFCSKRGARLMLMVLIPFSDSITTAGVILLHIQ